VPEKSCKPEDFPGKWINADGTKIRLHKKNSKKMLDKKIKLLYIERNANVFDNPFFEHMKKRFILAIPANVFDAISREQIIGFLFCLELQTIAVVINRNLIFRIKNNFLLVREIIP
jgi:hypothetical protein